MTVPDGVQIIDVDTHVVEPPDLWTSRMSTRWGDLVPHVGWHEGRQQEAWFIGDRWVSPVAASATAGWKEYPPDFPPRWSDARADTWDATQRVATMDEYGIHAQLLYPNVALFGAADLQSLARPEFQLELIRAYNDFQTDFAASAPGRFVPIASLPYWDLEATAIEMSRCAAMGHRGILFTQDPGAFGLPVLTDRHWDRLWAAAQEMGLPVNFHIASGDNSGLLRSAGHRDNGMHANFAVASVGLISANLRTISQLIGGGICHRFPDLDFVSVESGIGWIPFTLDALDWQWKGCGVAIEHPEFDLLPSEYFRRQIYGCFWFEVEALPYAIERLGPDNILYETDFPHPTSMTPGPASSAVTPPEHRARAFAGVNPEDSRKILHDNAARIYHLD